MIAIVARRPRNQNSFLSSRLGAFTMSRSILVFALLLASAFKIAGAANLEGRVAWNEVCPSYAELGHSKVVLDDGRYAGGIWQDGSFSIPDIDEGSYVLSVISHDYTFDNLRVDVYPTGEALPTARPYIPGTPHNPPSSVSLRYPVVLAPRQKADYFIERQSFDVLGMLRNPMVLMMLVMGVLMLGMPYIMKNLDPEMMKEVNGRQARYSNIQNAVQTGDFRGGISALLAETESDSPSPQTNSPKSGGGSSRSKTNKGGRRR
ncbi:hypothetical protein M0805_006998 [Coniferiporia weirii]|nr:hypothetical protein M0805_006998 [Coniferiporia weirii]